MFDNCEMSTDDVKKILMMYGNLQRLEVLNQKINNINMQRIKKQIVRIKEIQDATERNAEWERCILRLIDNCDEIRANVNLCNTAIHNILTAFEKLIVFGEKDTNESKVDGGRDGME